MNKQTKALLAIAATAMTVVTAKQVSLKAVDPALTIQSNLLAAQTEWLKTHNTPRIVPVSTTTDGYTYWVDSIVKWDGDATPESINFVINIKRPDGQSMVAGFGTLGTQLSHSWQSPVVNHSTSTP